MLAGEGGELGAPRKTVGGKVRKSPWCQPYIPSSGAGGLQTPRKGIKVLLHDGW